MSNNIVEENPAQDSKAPSGPQGQGAGGGQDKVRKQARQLAYDVRYKVKQSFKDGQKSDPTSLKNAYLSQLGKSPAPGPVRALAKKMLVGESYDFVDVKENVSKNVSNIIGKVFTKTTQIDDVDGNPAYEITDVVQEDSAVRKYKVRVTDKKSGKSYTRMADRAKISELRKNPNISSVEMTGYGSPYEGEKKKGSQTAAVKSGKGLAKKDFDGDGKVESPTAEYKGSKDKAIKKALHREEFIDEVNTEDDNPQANTKKIDVMKGKNKVKVMPNMGEQNELAPAKTEPDAKEKRVGLMKRMILQKKMQAVRSGAGADIVAHNEPEGNLIAENEPPIRDQDDQQIANVTFDGGGPDGGATIQGSGDPREIPTFVALIKNKMRARGILVNHNELEGEMVDEANKGERVADPYRAGKLSARPVGKRASKKDSTTARITADVGQRNRRRFDKRHGGDGSRKLNKFGSDYRVDKREGNSSESSDHAQKQRRAEHQAKRGVKTKGVKEEVSVTDTIRTILEGNSK